MNDKQRLLKTFPKARFDTAYIQTGGAPEKRRGWWVPSEKLGVGAVIPGQPGNWEFLGYTVSDAVARNEHRLYTPAPKRFTVVRGPRGNKVVETITLNGIDEDERLTPKLARRAALCTGVVSGGGVDVWSNEDYGYTLYLNTHRKRDIEYWFD